MGVMLPSLAALFVPPNLFYFVAQEQYSNIHGRLQGVGVLGSIYPYVVYDVAPERPQSRSKRAAGPNAAVVSLIDRIHVGSEGRIGSGVS